MQVQRMKSCNSEYRTLNDHQTRSSSLSDFSLKLEIWNWSPRRSLTPVINQKLSSFCGAGYVICDWSQRTYFPDNSWFTAHLYTQTLVIRLSKFRWSSLNTSIFVKINNTFTADDFYWFSPICSTNMNSDNVWALDFWLTTEEDPLLYSFQFQTLSPTLDQWFLQWQ